MNGPLTSPRVSLLSDEEALALAELPADPRGAPDAADRADSAALGDRLEALLARAAAVRDRAWGRTITFSPKVFLPLTNLCRNYCEYCSFRRSPGQAGEWTMRPDEVAAQLDAARQQGCVEALFCLGDKPETAFDAYRETLAAWGHDGTVDYIDRASRMALDAGLLPHTNAGVLDHADMVRLKQTNVSLGLMLENVSPRLGEPGGPHYRAPDKAPERRLRMIAEAGALRIPFTTGILLGIGETRRERALSLLAIRRLHREHGHIQEVIVQNFRARPRIPMRDAPEPDDYEIAHAVALARLILDDEVGVQAPPNLNPAATALLLRAGINDFGGISPVTPDYINPRHPWPHLDGLAAEVAHEGYALRPRLPIYDRYLDLPGFLAPSLREPTERARLRLAAVDHPAELCRAPAASGATPGPARSPTPANHDFSTRTS